MALFDTTWYCNAGDQATTGYYAVTKWAASTAVVVGALRRQFTTPTVGNERVFVCTIAGTTGASEPSWSVGRGAKFTDGTVTWIECTGYAAVNGDAANTLTWAAAKAIGGVVGTGVIIKRNSGASYQICNVQLTFGASEPAFSDTVGITANEGAGQWTSLGPVGNFTGGQAPHARLVNALASTWFDAGDTVYIGGNHAETSTTTVLNPAGGTGAVNKIICHNQSGPYPPTSSDLRTTAVVTTTGGNISFLQSTVPSTAYFYGITFRASAGNVIFQPSTGVTLNYENCSFEVVGAACVIQIGNSPSTPCTLNWNNCTVKFSVVAGAFMLQGTQFSWQNTGPILVTGSAVPNFLISSNGGSSVAVSILLEALDLSQITTSLFNNAPVINNGSMLVKDCKLSAALAAPTVSYLGTTIQYVRSSA